MSEYAVKVTWTRKPDETYIDNKYSRGHAWIFDGGMTVPASSSPQVVPLPYSVEQNVDPEEAFIAALSSCHMLFFLSIAAKRRFVIDEYLDEPIGLIEKGTDGKMAMTKVTLRPKITFSGELRPTLAQLEQIHHQSHDQCFIANSVTSKIIIEVRP
jgi:organic hydroperoxide reductase OsmC/OhrA